MRFQIVNESFYQVIQTCVKKGNDEYIYKASLILEK
jgi:hypothetical protein